MRGHPRSGHRALSRVLLVIAVFAVYFAAHAALESHGYQPSYDHVATSSPQHVALSHDVDGSLGKCHDGEKSQHVSHPQCLAIPRAGDGPSFDALAALIVVVPGSVAIGCPPRHRRATGPARSRTGRDVLRSVCVLRN